MQHKKQRNDIKIFFIFFLFFFYLFIYLFILFFLLMVDPLLSLVSIAVIRPCACL